MGCLSNVTFYNIPSLLCISSQAGKKDVTDCRVIGLFSMWGEPGGFLSRAGGSAGAVLEAEVSVHVSVPTARRIHWPLPSGPSGPRAPEGKQDHLFLPEVTGS